MREAIYCRAAAVIAAAVLTAAAAGCATLQGPPPAIQRTVEALGLERFDQIEEIRYTFNVKAGETQVRRSWLWDPLRDRVTFNGTPEQGGSLTYARAALAAGQAGEAEKKVDAWFINDNYWLLFPLRVYQDRSAVVAEDRDPAAMPIGGAKARRVTVSYPPSGGYTPGDVYELFVDESSRIRQWIYRKGGDPKPTRVAAWEDYRRFGPVLLSLDRRGPDGSFRVWFTEVAVRLKGENVWREGTAP